MSSRSLLVPLAWLTVGLFAVATTLVFFVAPVDADQGLSQKIFYIHVPIALTTYGCFGLAAWKGFRLLMTRDERFDLESYTAVHQGTIFGALTLITGSIWAKASWGRWWTWGSDQLVLFLVLFLFYCAYFMVRYSIGEGAQRERISAVYAIFGVAMIPVSFMAIRLASDFIHPTVFKRSGPDMETSMFVAFCVSWLGIGLLAYLMYRVEIHGKRVDRRLRELRESVA